MPVDLTSDETRIRQGGGPKAIAARMAEVLIEALEEAGLSTADLDGVGVGSPGSVDDVKGTVSGAMNLSDWTGSFNLRKVLEKEQYSFGFDAQNGDYGNLVSKGIIDPTKVVRTAIQNAASVAGLLITTEAMIAEVPKKNAAPAMPPGGGMGGMDF